MHPTRILSCIANKIYQNTRIKSSETTDSTTWLLQKSTERHRYWDEDTLSKKAIQCQDPKHKT